MKGCRRCLVLIISSIFFNVTLAQSAPHSYANAVKLATPSVVNIYTLKTQDSTNPRARDPFGRLQKRSGKRRYRLGSGVIMDTQGYILTNNHVTRRARKILIALPDGRQTQAKIIGTDPETDLAVLRISLKHLDPIELANSNDIEVGDIVLAIGNPFGLGQTVTQGIVSAIGRNTVGINQLENYIQTDAAINPGNSGGALINTQGKLIGINTGIYSRSGGYQGIGFAIPVNTALNVLKQITTKGSVTRGWLGVSVRTLTQNIAKHLGINIHAGVIVTEVIKNSPAAKAGLRLSDVITKINKNSISKAQGFQSIIAQSQPGKSLTLSIIRKGERTILTVKIGKRPPPSAIDDRGLPRQIPSPNDTLQTPKKNTNHEFIPDDRGASTP